MGGRLVPEGMSEVRFARIVEVPNDPAAIDLAPPEDAATSKAAAAANRIF